MGGDFLAELDAFAIETGNGHEPTDDSPEEPPDLVELFASRGPRATSRRPSVVALDGTPPATGVQPMTAISFAPPPDPLVRQFLAIGDGEGAIIYGPGGSMKGTTTAWLCIELVRADPDAVVYVLDYEHHPNEWGGRLRRLGALPDELERIHYASPYSREWTARRGLLHEVADLVLADCDRLGVSLVVVDSITTAAAAGEAMGGQGAANDYFDALAKIGRRSLSLAHVPGNAQRWADRPFGSVHLANLARETWAIEIVRSGAEEPDAHGLTSTEVELRCKKANGRRKPKPQVLAYTFEPDNGAITVASDERAAGHADLVAQVLRTVSQEWMTAKQIASAIHEDTGEKLTDAQVYDAVRYDKRSRFQIDKAARPRRFRTAGA